MTFTYGGNDFQFGKNTLDQARRDKALAHDADARSNYNSAIAIFKMCKDQHPEAANLLVQAEQELRDLG